MKYIISLLITTMFFVTGAVANVSYSDTKEEAQETKDQVAAETEETAQETKEKAQEMGSKDKHSVKSKTIEFDQGSHELKADQKEMIRDMVANLRDKGDNKDLGIAVWSDQPLPGQDQELTESERELASKRSDAITSFIDTLEFEGDVETYDMSTRPNWLSRLFDSTEAELKSEFAKKDKEGSTLMKDKFKAFKENGKPGVAVLVLSKDK